MALKLLAIGCIKSGSSVCGYRLIDYNDTVNKTKQNCQVKYLDLPSASIIDAIRSNKVVVGNLHIVNGELKGSNGQASRYGIIDAKTLKAKNQVMVIVSEVVDIKGVLVGYICSDTNGNIVRLLEEQAIAQAARLGLANGKLISGANGKYISAISGGYSALKLNYDYSKKFSSQKSAGTQNTQSTQSKETTKIAEQPKTATSTEQKQVEAEKKELSPAELYAKALKCISELEQFKAFKNDFSYKIASSIKRWKKCSEKQLGVLERALDAFKKGNAERVDTEPKKEQTKSTTDTQTKATEQPKSQQSPSKSDNTFASGIKPIEVDKSGIPEQNTNTEQTEPETKPEKPDAHEKEESQPVETEDTKPVELSDIIDNEYFNSFGLTLPVSDLSIFDFGIINNEIYVRGLKDDVEIPDNIIMPDTIKFNGQDKPVVGIAIHAFKNSDIHGIRTGKYIRDIGAGAFYNCRKLGIIDLSQSKHSMIPAEMACGCKDLKYVRLGDSVERIHELAFFGCRSLRMVDANRNIDTIARQAFAKCESLMKFNTLPKFVNEGAFEGCYSLTESGFDFTSTVSIGTKAFRGTGFKNLVLPGNVKSIGRKAFADCALLSTVSIGEGIELVDMYCFAKSRENCRDNIRAYERLGVGEDVAYCDTELIDTPKSLKDVGNDAFRHVKLVKVFTGSASESVCIGFNVPFERKDAIDSTNSTKVRQRSSMFNVDPIKMLFDHLNREVENASNPEFSIDSSKFLNAKLTDTHFNTLKFKKPSNNSIEPHIKFKAALKYAMDLAEPFTLPLTPAVLRFSGIIKIETKELFGDGWNEIYKTTFFKRDTLESGSFITFMQGDSLLYIVEASSALDIELAEDAYSDAKIPIKEHLHAGDKIGNDSTIDGRNAARYKYETEDGYMRTVNVGLKFFERIKENSIILRTTRTTYIYYVPATDSALVLFDSRKDKDESVYRNNNKYAYFTVTKILDYNQMLALISSDKNLKVSNDSSHAFFSDLSRISQSEANKMIASVKYVSEETRDTLYNAGLQCENMLKSKNMNSSDMTPNMLTYDMFMTLTESYWMVEKDLDWYDSISAKTLNKTNEYTIGSFTILEYRSNQVVKFNNPYMHGKKNSMIFVMKRGNQIYGVFASIYSLEAIASMLAGLTYLPDGYRENAPVLMTDASNMDEIDPIYFYNFYEVLQTNGGWDLSKNYGGFLNTFLNCMKSSYHLSMYKPTGVFYLTMDTYVIREIKDPKTRKKVEKTVNKVTYPIFPIGDMDRALMVADTTNTNNKYARFKDELVQLAIYEKAKATGREYVRSSENPDIDPTNYYKVRQMSIDGVQETFEYAKYVDDRAAFMIGRVHSGVLNTRGVEQAEFEDYDDTDETEYDDTEYDYDNTEISDDDFADFDDDNEFDDSDFEEFDDDDM